MISSFKETLALMFHEEGVSVRTKNSIMAPADQLRSSTMGPPGFQQQITFFNSKPIYSKNFET